MQLFLFVLLFAYAPMSAKTLSIWHCLEMGDGWYLSEDLNVRRMASCGAVTFTHQ